MFKVNDVVMYASYGVCEIAAIEEKDFSGENVEYYILAQFCKFVQPGAYRVKLDRRSVPDHLETTAIANADGSYVVFVLNNGNSECSFTLCCGDRKINHTLPRKTIGTYILNFK